MTERKMEELEFRAAVEVDGDLYFSAWRMNALLMQDGKTGTITYLGRVAEEEQEMNLHGSAFYANECIYFVPSSAEYIAKLRLADGVIEAIAIPEINEKSQRVKFHSSICEGDKIWMIPYRVDKLLSLNLRTDTVEVCEDWAKEKQEMTNLFWDGICISNCLCLCPAEYSYFVTYDMSEKKSKKWEWPYPKNAFSKMIYHKDMLWFFPDGTYPYILKYSLKEQSATLIDIPKGVIDNMNCAWGGAALIGDVIVLPPYESNYWLMVDTYTDKMEYIPFKANGKLANYKYPRYQFVNHSREGVIVMGDQCEEAHLIAGEAHVITKKTYVMDVEARLAYMRDVIENGATRDVVFYERDNSLESFLNTVVENA